MAKPQAKKMRSLDAIFSIARLHELPRWVRTGCEANHESSCLFLGAGRCTQPHGAIWLQQSNSIPKRGALAWLRRDGPEINLSDATVLAVKFAPLYERSQEETATFPILSVF